MIGVKSQDFYALDEYRMEFIEWLALYETWLSLDERYRQLVTREPVALQIKTNLESTHA
jgi:hypothetical protein